MSKAIELAESLGVTFNYLGHPQCVFATNEMIESFYHASRAEALREAAEFAKTYATQHAKDDDESKAQSWMMLQCSIGIRAMADREGQ